MNLRLRRVSAIGFSDVALVIGGLSATAGLAGLAGADSATSGSGLLWSAWLMLCTVLCAFRAMAHADRLAERFGEPVGTVVLTVSAITIEVASVCAFMVGSHGDPTVARDSMFSVLMIILNGFVGGCILLGTARSHERRFNPDASSMYLPLIVAMGFLALVLPRLATSEEGGWMTDGMEVFVGGGCLGVYLAFLWMQTSRYRGYFALEETSTSGAHGASVPVTRSVVMLLVSLLIVVMGAKCMAGRVGAMLQAVHLPSGFGGVIIAMMVLAPEGLAALRASRHGDMQRSINVLLGSAVSTIGLTVPAVLAMRAFTDIDAELGLEVPYIGLLAATFLVSSLTLMRGRVNTVHGLLHLLLFFGWLITILDESLPTAGPGPD
ncbi:MAG: ionic transporter y4hA [Planctomycetes bacterium]|nr:ionic transporter y4hA [Planctomycetota bacterium]